MIAPVPVHCFSITFNFANDKDVRLAFDTGEDMPRFRHVVLGVQGLKCFWIKGLILLLLRLVTNLSLIRFFDFLDFA